MVKDNELKPNRIYWAKVTEETHRLYMEYLNVKFTGIFFRDVKELSNIFYLHQLMIHRELDAKELKQFEVEENEKELI